MLTFMQFLLGGWFLSYHLDPLQKVNASFKDFDYEYVLGIGNGVFLSVNIIY